VREARESEFAGFFAATWSRLFRITYALTGDMGQAEDALQSAFVKAYASWHRVRAAEQPEAYVRRMAVNEVLGVRRRLWWKLERTGLPPERMELRSLEDDLVDRTQMWAALMGLPPGQRAVLVLRYYVDLSEEGIADVLGCSRGTVKSQASDALSALRRRYATASITEGTVS
jgi:RNA polymerase sigma-70 factor (sigma-E family)